MRKSMICFLVPFLLLVACKSRKLPANILPLPVMQQVMWDMIRAGEFVNGFVTGIDTGKHKGARAKEVYDQVLQVHKITRQQFDESFAYYQQHPVLMKTLLDSLAGKDHTEQDPSLRRRNNVLNDTLQQEQAEENKPDTLAAQ